jgi:hypothetical protein
MRHAYLRLLATSATLLGSHFSAHAAPVANLPLTCSSASAIGQPQDNCDGTWAYQLPTSDQLIVLRSNGTWARAANLAGNDEVAVCALAVEPSTYSSCRDANVRLIFNVPKSQVFRASAPNPVIAQVTFSNVRSIRTGGLAHYTGSDQWIGFDVLTPQVAVAGTGQVLSFGPNAFFAVRNLAFESDDPARSTRYCLEMIRSLALNPTPGTQLTLFLNVTQESVGGPNFIVHTFDSCNLELANP